MAFEFSKKGCNNLQAPLQHQEAVCEGPLVVNQIALAVSSSKFPSIVFKIG